MKYPFSDCNRSNFFETHTELEIGPWRVRYIGFARAHTRHLPPVVLIGGAFQNAWSFHDEVAGLLDMRPILIIELPGQGGNTQVCADCTFTDLAKILAQVLDALDLDHVIPIGLSYGAAIVHRFAVLFPQRASQVVLVGVAPRLPAAAYRLSQAFSWLLQQNRKMDFATALTQHLFNVSAMRYTGVSEDLMQRLAGSILKFDANQIDRFDANLHRLYVEELQGQPRQTTLVLAGRHDSFIPPQDSLAVADSCPQGLFAISTDCDHLAPLERPMRLVSIYRALLQDEPVDRISSMLTGARAAQALAEQRLSPRCWGRQARLLLTSPEGQELDAELVDISSHGCRVNGDFPADATQQAAPWQLRFAGTDVHTEVLPYRINAGDTDTRLLFFNTNFSTTANLKKHIETHYRCREHCPQYFISKPKLVTLNETRGALHCIRRPPWKNQAYKRSK